MIVRALDINGDWKFGKGKNDYLRFKNALSQNIKTRVSSFLGDCFFDTEEGIDWFNLLGAKNRVALNLAISATILNTQNVIKILELSIDLDENRNISISYSVEGSVGVVTGVLNATTATTNRLLTEGGIVITDEYGNPIGV